MFYWYLFHLFIIDRILLCDGYIKFSCKQKSLWDINFGSHNSRLRFYILHRRTISNVSASYFRDHCISNYHSRQNFKTPFLAMLPVLLVVLCLTHNDIISSLINRRFTGLIIYFRQCVAFVRLPKGGCCSISDDLSCSCNIYTHRQKLSNSKLILNIKKCFVPKYWKFKFHYLHLASFG